MHYIILKRNEWELYFDATMENWHINSKEIDYNLSELTNLSPFLQVFYEDPQVFFDSVSAKIGGKVFFHNAIDKLPFKESIIFCIKNRMLFWLELAIKWFDFISIDDELKMAIDSVSNDKKVPQKLRHQLKKLS